MNKTFLIFLLLSSSFVFGQENKFNISGKVTNCRTHDFIKSVTIKLVGSDGTSIETTTDSSGYYIFGSKRINPNTRYVVTTQVDNNIRNPKNKLGLFEFF